MMCMRLAHCTCVREYSTLLAAILLLCSRLVSVLHVVSFAACLIQLDTAASIILSMLIVGFRLRISPLSMKLSKAEQKATQVLALPMQYKKPSMQAQHASAGPVHQR